MSGAPPPYTGLATRLSRTMSDTTEATLGTRLAKARDRIEEMEDTNDRLEAHCSEYEEALHAAYDMLDRYADEVSDEAYRAIEGEIMQKTEPELAEQHEHPLEAENEALDEEAQQLGECLYDLKTHVENADLGMAFRYPDTVRSLLDRADTLLEGRVEGVQPSRADLEAENERLRHSLDWVRGRVKRAASLVLEHAHDEEMVEDLYDDVDDEVASVLDRAEDGQS